MFETIELAPADPILGLTEAFKQDRNPHKINLGVGVYKDASGCTPVLQAVKEAERFILENEKTKTYVSPNSGAADFTASVRQLLFGADAQVDVESRAITAHTPGGTGALRIAADYLRANHSTATIWLSEPTWDNHEGVFKAAGVPVRRYAYFNTEGNDLALVAMLESLEKVPEGDVVLLHGGCHNPTGVDPGPDQWSQIADLLDRKRLLPLIDFAYQGFADGLEDDAHGVRTLCRRVPELMVCSSFSKNFGLYNERVGALTIVTASRSAAEAVLSQLKVCVRRCYSNPPAHGSTIVTTILGNPHLRSLWETELTEMRKRIHGVRRVFVQTLKAKGAARDFSFIIRQRGMFSFSGLTQQQVQTLRDHHSIYIVASGRINVAGMTEANMDRLCQAIVDVL